MKLKIESENHSVDVCPERADKKVSKMASHTP